MQKEEGKMSTNKIRRQGIDSHLPPHPGPLPWERENVRQRSVEFLRLVGLAFAAMEQERSR
jgi:hypothetical protein